MFKKKYGAGNWEMVRADARPPALFASGPEALVRADARLVIARCSGGGSRGIAPCSVGERPGYRHRCDRQQVTNRKSPATHTLL